MTGETRRCTCACGSENEWSELHFLTNANLRTQCEQLEEVETCGVNRLPFG